LEDLEVHGMTILKYMLKELFLTLRNGLLWLKIGVSGGFCEGGNETSGSRNGDEIPD
jgi:hypothetical protein